MNLLNLSLLLAVSLPNTSSAAFGTSALSATSEKRTTVFSPRCPTIVLRSTEVSAETDVPTFVIPTTVTSNTMGANNVLMIERLPLGVKLTGGTKLREEGLTGKGVKIAVIDSGVDVDHPGFNDQVKQQVWYRSGSPLSRDDHGTHVAGTIHMMAPEAELYDYRVFGDRGWIGTGSAIARSIRSAVEDGCDIINMSIQAGRRDSRIYNAMRDAYDEGVLMVAAAGNSGDGSALTNENSWPANSAEAISVGAVSKVDNLPVANFSNTNDEVDYAGIGVNVDSFRPGGSWHKKSGTSMACPHVCGFIAALMTKGGRFEDQVKDDATLRKLLEEFVIDIGVEGRDTATGLGFLTYLSKEEFEEGFLDLPDH